MLVRALGLTDDQAAVFKASARRVSRADTVPEEGTSDSTQPAERDSPETESSQAAASDAGHHRSEAPRGNLPLALTSFIGREEAEARVRDLLGSRRLVTLTGAGGCGKTRLALQVAGSLAASYADGVWLVELAAVADAAYVPAAAVEAVGAREDPGRSGLPALIAYLREKHTLLVLDNCEHLVVACAEMAAALLSACPGVRILATSREELGVAGEQIYRVPSLSLPRAADAPPADIGAAEAVRLFVDRAQAHDAEFTLGRDTAGPIAEICARLDGIPLAIELAAARVKVIPVQVIAARLDESFRLLVGGPRTQLPRQQTLRAAMDWSYNLLDAEERALLSRLAVFAGGWTLEAADAVCVDPPGAHDTAGGSKHQHPGPLAAAMADPRRDVQRGLVSGDVLQPLTQLVSKSLVIAEHHESGTRYSLLEIVRQYGHERLRERGEAALIQQRHAAYYLHLAEQVEPALAGPEQAAWLARLALEHDNLRAALGWARATGSLELGLRLAGTLWRFWQIRGHVSEGRRWLADLMAQAETAGEQIAAAVRAKACDGAGSLARIQGEYTQAAALCAQALEIRRAIGDRAGIGASLNSLGLIAYQQAAYAQAAAYYEESLAVYRDLGDRLGTANVLNNLGMVASYVGDYGRAAALYEASLAHFRALGHARNSANALNNLGGVRLHQGEYAMALSLFEESLALFEALEDRGGMALVLEHLGEAAARQGMPEQAITYHRRSLTMAREVGDRELAAWNLHGLAAAAFLRSQRPDSALGEPAPGADAQPTPTQAQWLRRAVRLFGAAEGLRAALGSPLPSVDRPWYDRIIQGARQALDPDAFGSEWAAGEAWPVEEAIAYALVDGPG